ncbi:hypothetical protein OH76DRAFT_1489122 [Lentinus brumalis]|uniref:Protein SMG7 n=1 Tax=Lentinus brumalis TaxID=2498619 RepID=A0A371CNK0_9APHY|nr:hypothetical protein OH76DRAFT_1489122 [Polyporus brumalis]
MTEEAAHIAREAKALQQTLKEALKTKDPWDKETDFTRKQLRRNCLRLLLLHPYAPESKDAENQLWMQTSYAFIAGYKQRITQLDRALHSAPRQNQQQQQQGQGQGQGQGQQHGRGHGGHGVVEYRKLLQRFRQFLADEEKFWVQLIVRIRRIFQLDDAQSVLSDLGIVPEESPAAESGPPRRNHFQFPSDADVAAAAPSLTPSTREQRDSRMAILSKALVCLGDIERYKEQYNEAGGRPRAGHEDGPPAAGANGNQKGRGKKGGANGPQPPIIPRMRNYDKAQQCYQQARILLPQDGNPAHQMAILASYQKDVFNSLVHYYRALCVRSPYDTAAENLGTVLSKTFDQWKARGAKRDKEREKEQARGEVGPMAPRLRVEAFKEKLIVLHALWRIPREEADAISPNLASKLADEFKSLVTERVLPLDIILKTVVLAQGALWKHRMFRTAPTNGHKKGLPPAVSTAVENSIVGHLLLMHRVLLEVGIAQIAEGAPEDNGEADLAQRITAAFRRTLPALRIASKWLRANLRYLTQSSQLVGEVETNSVKAKGRDRRRGGERRSSSMSLTLSIPSLSEFWRTYAQFSTALIRAFPVDKLPKLATALEEDVEMAGFLPLKKFVPNEVVGVAAGTPNKEGLKPAPAYQTLLPDQVHPNEEQLMRIDDLLRDAEALAIDELSPLTFSDGRFAVKGFPDAPEGVRRVPAPPPLGRVEHHPRQPALSRMPPTSPPRVPPHSQGIETDDDNMTDITRTEDDPVDRAFREVLGAADEVEEAEEDEIVWNPGPRDPAIIAAIPAVLPVSPPRPAVASPLVVSPALISPRSPPALSPQAELPRSVGAIPSAIVPTTSTMTTAQDILASVLHPSPPKADLAHSLHARQASAPQPHMLFGSNPLGGGPSIWSSNESSGLGFQGAAGTTSGPLYQSSYQSQGQLQSSPSSTFPTQSALGFGHPSVPLGPAHQYNSPIPSGNAHQRIHSLSVIRSQIPSSQPQSQMSDPFGSFPALTEQAPISYHTGVPGAYADPVYSRKLDPSYVRQEAPGMHDRSIPYHLDRGVGHGNGFPPSLSSMAQLWNNAG